MPNYKTSNKKRNRKDLEQEDILSAEESDVDSEKVGISGIESPEPKKGKKNIKYNKNNKNKSNKNKEKVNSNNNNIETDEKKDGKEEKKEEKNIVAIKDIDCFKFSKKTVIVGKVVRVSELVFRRSKNYFNFELGDSDGNESIISVKSSGVAAMQLSKRLKQNDVIYIKGLSCGTNHDRYVQSNNKLILYCNNNEVRIRHVESEQLSNLIVPDLIRISEIDKLGNGNKISFIGYVIDVETEKSTSKGKLYQWIEVVDFSKTKIRIKIFGDAVKKYGNDELLYSSILISFGEISEWKGGKTVTVWNDFDLLDFKEMNYDGVNVLVKRSIKFENSIGGNTQKLKQLCHDATSLNAEDDLDWDKIPEKPLVELKNVLKNCVSNQTALPYTYVKCKGYIGGYYDINNTSEEWYYSSKDNNKKVMYDGVSRYYDTSKQKFYKSNEVKRVWCVKMYWSKELLEPMQTDVSVSVFDEGCEKIFKISADKGYDLKKKNIKKYKELLDKTKKEQYLMCVRLNRRSKSDNSGYYYNAVLENVFDIENVDDYYENIKTENINIEEW